MVFVSFDDFDDHYEHVRRNSCGRQSCTVLIIVALEVDAIASTTMLCQLLRGDHIAYTVRAVTNLRQMMSAFQTSLTSDIKTLFLVNCGAIHDIPKLLELEQGGDLRCFILDNHRPIHLKNYYSKHNVVVFGGPSDFQDIPSDGSELSSEHSDDSDDSEASRATEDSEDLPEEEALDERNKVPKEEEEEEELFGELSSVQENEADDEENREDEEEELEGEEVERNDVQSQSKPDEEEQESSQEDNEEAVVEEGEGEETQEDGDGALRNVDDDKPVEDDDSIQPILKKRRIIMTESAIQKLKRQRVLKYYRQAPSYAPPTAIVLLPFVKAKFSGNSYIPVDVVWQAILGMTDQYLRYNITEEYYNLCCQLLKIELGDHLTQASGLTVELDSTTENTETVTVTTSCEGQIMESLEYRFFMYRHWPLYDAISHSLAVATVFPVWKTDGLRKLQVLLAEVGISLQQCSQAFPFIEPQARRRFEREILNPTLLTKYNLTAEELTFKSFCRHFDFKNPVAAVDIAIGAEALLEMADTGNTGDDLASAKYFQASKLLSVQSSKGLSSAVDIAIGIQRAILKQATALLDSQDLIQRYHRIYYAYIRNALAGSKAEKAISSKHSEVKGRVHDEIFGQPSALLRLGQYVMTVKRTLPRSSGGWNGKNLLPLVLLSELLDEHYLVVGISPLLHSTHAFSVDPQYLGKLEPLTNFQQFFKLAAKDLHIDVHFDFFEPCCVKVAKDDIQEFIGALDNAMRKATPNFMKTV